MLQVHLKDLKVVFNNYFEIRICFLICKIGYAKSKEKVLNIQFYYSI